MRSTLLAVAQFKSGGAKKRGGGELILTSSNWMFFTFSSLPLPKITAASSVRGSKIGERRHGFASGELWIEGTLCSDTHTHVRELHLKWHPWNFKDTGADGRTRRAAFERTNCFFLLSRGARAQRCRVDWCQGDGISVLSTCGLQLHGRCPGSSFQRNQLRSITWSVFRTQDVLLVG